MNYNSDLYTRVTGNSNEIPILNSNSSVGLLTQLNEEKSIKFIYMICLYHGFGIWINRDIDIAMFAALFVAVRQVFLKPTLQKHINY